METTKFVVKVKWDQENRRLTLNALSYKELCKNFLMIFGDELKAIDFTVNYIDEDNDEITVCTDQELAEAWQVSKRGILKLFIKESGSDDFVIVSSPERKALEPSPVESPVLAPLGVASVSQNSSVSTASQPNLPVSLPLTVTPSPQPMASVPSLVSAATTSIPATSLAASSTHYSSFPICSLSSTTVSQESVSSTKFSQPYATACVEIKPVLTQNTAAPYLMELHETAKIIPVQRTAPYVIESSSPAPIVPVQRTPPYILAASVSMVKPHSSISYVTSSTESTVNAPFHRTASTHAYTSTS